MPDISLKYFIFIPPTEGLIKTEDQSIDMQIKVSGKGSFRCYISWFHEFYPGGGGGFQQTVPFQFYPPPLSAPTTISTGVVARRYNYMDWGQIPYLVPISGHITLYPPDSYAAYARYWLLWSFVFSSDIEAGRAKLKQAVSQFGQGSLGQMSSHLDQIKSALNIPDMRFLDSKYPDIVSAAEPFSASHQFYNAGSPGEARLSLISDGTDMSQSFMVDRQVAITEELTMPWNDLSRLYTGQLFAKVPAPIWIEELTLDGRTYKPLSLPDILTDSKSWVANIKAGFPEAAMGEVESPSWLKPGDALTLDFPITNTGYKGDVGVRIIAPDYQEDIMQRIDSGATITPSFSGEMPVAESYRLTAVPIYLGRNKETVLGAEKVIEIRPMNALFHWDEALEIFGGYDERNEFTGFVAGKNVTVSGLTITPGTGPLPFGYAGYMLTGTLGKGEEAVIGYDELYYLRVESVKGIAAARRGVLVEKDTKLYEYSVLPTPTMASYAFKAIGSLFTRTGPKLAVKR